MPGGEVGAVSAEGPLALPERPDQTGSEGRTAARTRIARERNPKTFAPQPWLGYADRAGMSKMEILAKTGKVMRSVTTDCKQNGCRLGPCWSRRLRPTGIGFIQVSLNRGWAQLDFTTRGDT